jgi:hypothetical protein
MTRDEAIKIWRFVALKDTEAYFRATRPQAWCDDAMKACSEGDIDGLIALGLLKVGDVHQP